MDAILTRYRVHGLLYVRYTERFWELDGCRDSTVRLEWDGQVTVSLDVNRTPVNAAMTRGTLRTGIPTPLCKAGAAAITRSPKRGALVPYDSDARSGCCPCTWLAHTLHRQTHTRYGVMCGRWRWGSSVQ